MSEKPSLTIHPSQSGHFFIEKSSPLLSPTPIPSSPAPNGLAHASHGASGAAFPRPPAPEDGPGTLPDEVYDGSMAPWRAAIRRVLVRNLRTESQWLAAMQKRVRTSWLDTYFVYTSSLGTHTFFMTVLPAFFFFGHEEAGRGLVHVLATGVYVSSFIKDSICSPRPYAPPVTRLTMGSHHLEYGFPSTHSTNSVSIALYLYSLISSVYATSDILSPTAFLLAQIALGWYTFSIVFGRLYCAMHSFTDCIVGVILGAAIWACQWAWGGVFEQWMTTEGWTVPITVIAVGLVLVNQHAEPVDDCPCFEDAIAFVSVVMGSTLARWHASNWGLDQASGFFVSRTPGWQGRDISDWSIWFAFAALKMVFGVFVIFTWRLVAKAVLHVVLPPVYRFLAHLVTLPNRRFYTPATDYKSVPQDKGLHPIPSLIDVPTAMATTTQTSATLPRYAGGLKWRNGRPTPSASPVPRSVVEKPAWNQQPDDDEEVKHYDADVMTKVIVYCGIAIIATHVLPVTFELLGWGVLSSPPPSSI